MDIAGVEGMITTAAAAGVASAAVATGFGRWVLSCVKEAREDFNKRLDAQQSRLDGLHAKVDRLNGSVAENTRARIMYQDAAPNNAAALATLSTQLSALNKQVSEGLLPIANLAAHLREK